MRNCAYFLGLFVVSGLFHSESLGLEKKVQVESPYQFRVNKNGEKKFIRASYRERRPQWGVRLNFAVSSGFETQKTQVKPDDQVADVLSSTGSPFNVNISMSKNFKHFSVGPEIGYMSSKIADRCNLEFDFNGFTFGGGFYLDGLFKTPYVVPFASVGVILPDIEINATQTGTCTFSNKQELISDDYVLYYRTGLLVGLNWIDKTMAYRALSDYGLQNTFLYFAMRQIPSTSDVETADIGTEPFFEYGLQFEF